MKKLLGILVLGLLWSNVGNAGSSDKIGMTHEFGVSIPIHYKYVEPTFVEHDTDFEDDPFESYGLTYNFKKAFLFNDYLNELEFDAHWKYNTHDYWSNSYGLDDDYEQQTYNLRLLYGLQVSDKMMLKSGFGYRFFDYQWAGKVTSSGDPGYDREQTYHYIPLIAELDFPIADINGRLKIEYDHIKYGYHEAFWGAPTYTQWRNDDGYAWKTSYKFPFDGFYLEPYYEFMSIEESNRDSGGYYEPGNTTREYGIKFSKRFGETGLSTVTGSKRVLQKNNYFSDKFYVGLNYFQSTIDSGVTLVSGGASLDEKDRGFSILSGFEVNDFLDIEIGFNEFGESLQVGNTNDTFKTDGRFQHGKYASGELVTVTVDDVRNTINSHSGSLAIKPKFNFANGLFINADLGIHRWTQTEHQTLTGSSVTDWYYSSYDTFYGIGTGIKKNNFAVSLNYKDFDMRYNATIIGASIKYNF